MNRTNEPHELQAKICLITGATSGIGFETARAIALQGAETLLVSRNLPKVQKTVEQLKSETSNSQIHGFTADLSSQQEIRELAAQVKAKFDRLDILINNAGGFFLRKELSPDGIEKSWALNHLNYFLTTQQLLPLLASSKDARIINVSSDAHRSAQINFEDLQFEAGYSGWQAYAQSKLANVLFTYELVRRLQTPNITVNALHPGFVATGFGFGGGVIEAIGKMVTRLFGKSPREGAQTSIYLASSPEVEGITGKYFTDQNPVKSSPASYDLQTARKLWQVSLDMIAVEEYSPFTMLAHSST